MDQLLLPVFDAQQFVLPQLSGGQLHTDGGKHTEGKKEKPKEEPPEEQTEETEREEGQTDENQ